ncbi:MAG TPA: LytTR family DNA-binding domain-containing protein [Bacteroidales bacterium]|nr:LytTR family DNA-binding domain-containing protein [Bacteroidales bacterium]
METISAMIIDDEPQAIDTLVELLKDFKEFEIRKKFYRATDALNYLLDTPDGIDLIFLDINLPQMNGFDFLKELQNYSINPCIVFFTGFDEYAIKAIRAAAFDFFLKPVSKDDIKQFLERYKIKHVHEKLEARTKILFENLEPVKKMVFPLRRGIVAFHPDEIFYITADWNYSNLILTSGKKQLVTLQIGKIERMIPPNHFFRIDRSTLINLKYFKNADFQEKKCFLSFDGKSQVFKITPKKIKEIQKILLEG